MRVILFSSPILNIEGQFNTIRLGGKLTRELEPQQEVLLIDANKTTVICKALVESTVSGPLNDIAEAHAALNHNQKHLDPVEAPSRLKQAMIKRYGPHKVRDNSTVSVIYLRVLENGD